MPAPGPVAPLQQQLEHASQKAGFVDDKYKPRQQVGSWLYILYRVEICDVQFCTLYNQAFVLCRRSFDRFSEICFNGTTTCRQQILNWNFKTIITDKSATCRVLLSVWCWSLCFKLWLHGVQALLTAGPGPQRGSIVSGYPIHPPPPQPGLPTSLYTGAANPVVPQHSLLTFHHWYFLYIETLLLYKLKISAAFYVQWNFTINLLVGPGFSS